MENIEKINNIIQILESDNENNTLEHVLEQYDWPPEIFFITLVSQIINELTNIENKAKEKDLLNYNTSFLFKMISLFCNVKYHHAITKEILDYIITKENLDLIFDKIIIINNAKENSIEHKKMFENFNNNIVNLLITIMNFNNKGFIDIIVNNRNSDSLLKDLFTIFTENEYSRNFLYNLEKNFVKYFPGVKSFKENMNYTIYYLNQYLEKDKVFFFKIKEEINIILLIYKNDIELITIPIQILLMNIFEEFEKNEEKNWKDSITTLLKNCFNNFVFADKKSNNNKDNKNEYNYKFMDFTISLYNQLIKSKLKKSYTLLLYELFQSLDQQQSGAKKYKWLIKNTHFKTVINSLINLKDESLLTIYFTKIMTLSAPSNSKSKEDYYMPDEDIFFFISNLVNIIKDNNDKNDVILNMICSMIINLISINKQIINIILNKCKIIDILISLACSEKYNITIRNKLLNLLEDILKINNFKYQYEMKISIQKDINEINKRLYSFSLLYEKNIKNLEKQISDITKNMLLYLNNNNYESFFSFNDIIILYITKNITNKINFINSEITSELNNIYVYASQKIIENENKKQNENIDNKEFNFFEIKKKLIKYLIEIIYELNMNNFRIKLHHNKLNYKIIFSENTIYIVIKNLLSGKTKKQILNYMINNICLEEDIKDNNNVINNIDNINNIINVRDSDLDYFNDINRDKIYNDINYNNFYLLKSSKIVYMIIVALYDNNDEECLAIFYNKLEEIINFSSVNIKILLNYDIISIMIKSLLKFENQDFFEKIKTILNKISKYLDEKSLIIFISKIYFISYEALIYEENKNNKKKEVIIELFNILKNGLTSSKKKKF